ncbi:cache domain-containing sensor histidine kinase [Paenibacillus mucilaginosus]|uniref:histidine kinase n=1 Tax=Paenibacillus mucilaginosus (strain KNP414) TaxID=1036673 RepID=F8FKC8_PAEMK|nr:sensor histidine kinase [Paenibacillus mucilaginosus]AEI44809.1 Cache sensor signal transduction histidine kinase [Paenibacillus mucilaginosus KNP414]MCG7214856.1 sensor histidine kinase [Paenibacillus mucilaginosus]WDM26337.1 sensor histidine kinase [Paenibacillus mucilaginosus]
MRGVRLFQYQSIHTQIALAFSALILCTTIILSYTAYRLSSDAVTGTSLEYTKELVRQVHTNVENYIYSMESIASLALSSGELKRYASLPRQNSEEGEELGRRLGDYFRSVLASRKDMASILFVGGHGGMVGGRSGESLKPSSEVRQQEWYLNAHQLEGGTAITSSHVQQLYRGEYPWVVSISKALPSTAAKPSGEGADGGVLLVDLNYSVIDNLCKQIQLGRRGYVFILAPSGDLVYHPQQQILNTQLKTERIPDILESRDGTMTFGRGAEQKIYTVSTTRFGWKVVGVVYPEDLARNKRAMQGSAALWGSLCLAVALSISVILSFRLTRPIKALEGHMKLAEKGDFGQRVEIESTNEIGKLARTFNVMIGRIQDLMEQIVQEQEQKRISELKALQAQIKPHFLYNTLDSIIWMAETRKVDEVVTMTSALAKLLRSSINQGEEWVPLAVELEQIRHYLTIQQIRYRRKFTYSIEVPEELYPYPIVKLVLQPIVENAIYHGIKHKAEPGHIRISGRRGAGGIELAVSDDGVGMTPEKLQTILGGTPRTKEAPGGSGVGVHNVHQRIALAFGPGYGLGFESELEEGTTVTIRLPELEDKGGAAG